MSSKSHGLPWYVRADLGLEWAWASVPLRLMVGFAFIFHGWTKFTPAGREAFVMMMQPMHVSASSPVVWLVPSLEILGGIMILLGALIWLFAPLFFMILLVAMVTHLQMGAGFSVLNVRMTPAGAVYGFPGYEIDLFYMSALLALLLGGAGRFSIAEYLKERLTRCEGSTPLNREEGVTP